MYKKYQEINIDKSYIGLEEGETEGGYFCTPVGSKVIGWESCCLLYTSDAADEL